MSIWRVVDILSNTEKQGGLDQQGGWQDMARRRYQKGSIRKRGKRHPVWELQWWTDTIGEDGTEAGIDDPRLCVRDYAAAGFEARRRASAPAEYGESDASLKPDVRAI